MKSPRRAPCTLSAAVAFPIRTGPSFIDGSDIDQIADFTSEGVR